jgi:hypothetical protein
VGWSWAGAGFLGFQAAALSSIPLCRDKGGRCAMMEDQDGEEIFRRRMFFE